MDAKRVEVKLRLTKQKNYGGRACKPDSVRAQTAVAACAPRRSSSSRLSLPGSSSLPEGFHPRWLAPPQRSASLMATASGDLMNADSVSRAGSPFLFGLAPTLGFSVPRVAPGRWVYPPFFTCQTMLLCEGVPQVFLRRCPVPCRFRRPRSILCLRLP